MDSIPNGTPLTGKLSARNWPAQFGGRGSVKPALPTPINHALQRPAGAPWLPSSRHRRRVAELGSLVAAFANRTNNTPKTMKIISRAISLTGTALFMLCAGHSLQAGNAVWAASSGLLPTNASPPWLFYPEPTYSVTLVSGDL